jgi:hypothetical protein
MAFNPGDIVKIVGMQDTLGRPTNEFGGNGGFATVQGTSFHPQSGNVWVFVKSHVQGPIYQLPAANIQATTSSNPPLPLPGVQPGFQTPGHHRTA